MIASYTFLPWLRRGLSNQITQAAGPGVSRARVDVSITVGSDVATAPPIVKPITLVGPGDITGFNQRQVIRTEPRVGTADFEPNYLAAIDLYDEDFPWRYSSLPVAPGHQLVPWILLIVLRDGEFERMNIPDRKAPAIRLTTANPKDVFPVPGQEWAWAHVHLNATIGTGTTPDLPALKSLLDTNPDAAYARLISPRKLLANTTYTAFVVPTFDVGRRAGLGETVADNEDGSRRSWLGASLEMPVYYSWRFRTGVEGDFELLVRALVPRDMDPRVGVRDMDISKPGFQVPTATNPPDDHVSLEGALLAPATQRRGLVPESNFAPQVRSIVNRPADERDTPPASGIGAGDPLIAPPIYGGWHAGVERVQTPDDDPGWVSALNLDPRYRAAAGLGARVVRKHQDAYMRSAWEQIGDVLSINAKIKRAQLATKAAFAVYSKTLAKLAREPAAALASPVFAKILGSPVTLHALVLGSRLPRAALSPAFRKLLRPRGRLARRMLPAGAREGAVGSIIAGINDGSLSAAPPAPKPDGATLEGIGEALRPPAWVAWVLRHAWWLILLVIALALLTWGLFGFSAALALGAVLGAIVAGAIVAARQRCPQLDASEALQPPHLTPAATIAVPPRPDYTYAPPADDPLLPPTATPPPSSPIAGDSAAAADVRRALTDYHAALSISVPSPPVRAPLDLGRAHALAIDALEPHTAFAMRFSPLMRVGDESVIDFTRRYKDISDMIGGGAGTPAPPPAPAPRRALREVMNYPDIKDPMYFPLSEINTQYFVPNLELIPNNTISLMQTNQPFIESYLVGLNHEFARELLWNEYPTDMQGSCFRQFWDTSNVPNRDDKDAKEFTEELKDIPRIHEWERSSPLGAHNHRDAQGDRSQVVLVIRGDLLKRYPHIIIYAQQAMWSTDPRRKHRLVLADETGELYVKNKKDPRLRFPLYRARVAPDIHFIGFDLTIAEVKGDPTLTETAESQARVHPQQLGWFFVLQEVVGDPRFGLDIEPPIEPAPSPSWSDLAWTNVDLSGGERIDLAKPLLGTTSKTREDGTTWGANASDMAYILYQEPVMVGIHGSEMLKNIAAPG